VDFHPGDTAVSCAAYGQSGAEKQRKNRHGGQRTSEKAKVVRLYFKVDRKNSEEDIRQRLSVAQRDKENDRRIGVNIYVVQHEKSNQYDRCRENDRSPEWKMKIPRCKQRGIFVPEEIFCTCEVYYHKV
jgi:hypothetical protein